MYKISDLDPQLQNWIEGYLNQTISKSDFESLQKAMLGDPELRYLIRRYLNLDCHLVAEGGLKTSDLSLFRGPRVAPMIRMIRREVG